MTTAEKKQICEQCHEEKDIDQFRKVTNQYTGVHPMSICKDCYNRNNEDRKRKQEEELEARKARAPVVYYPVVDEAEREARAQAEQQRQVLARELSIQANQRCPRCKQLRTDGHVWPDGRLYFPRFCGTCVSSTPHSIYKMICPLIRAVRYIGITTRSLNKRLSQHMTGNSGTEYKQSWINDLRLRGLKPQIEPASEAPNEREAQLEELRHIYHAIQQGYPIVNSEAMSLQRVLDLQSSTTNWLQASQEEINSCSKPHTFKAYMSAQAFRCKQQEQRHYQIIRWQNRHEQFYIIYNCLDVPSLYGTSYERLNLLREQYALSYADVLTSKDIPTDIQERDAYLEKITRVLLYTDTDDMLDSLAAHDCQFFLDKGISIQVDHHDRLSFETKKGVLISLACPMQKHPKKRQWEPLSPHGAIIMRSYSYTVPIERSLAIIPSHTFHEWAAYEYKRSNRYTISEPLPSVHEVQTGSLW
jgi:hypothetical protein